MRRNRRPCVGCRNLRKVFTFTMNARLNRPGTPSAVSLSRSSLYTTNSSLPGRYSQRSRALALTVWVLELY